jgi:TctA family transporter
MDAAGLASGWPDYRRSHGKNTLYARTELADGIGFVAVTPAVFGFAKVMTNLEQKEQREVVTNKVASPIITPVSRPTA